MSERISPEVLADIADPQDLCISPDGKRVVYKLRPRHVRGADHIRASLWIAEVGKENSARQMTTGACNDYAPKFSPDGRHISFLSDRSKPGRASVLYLLPLEGGEALPLTSEENEMGVGAYEWNPGSESIAFVSADEKSDVQKQKQKDKNDCNVYDEDVEIERLRVVDLGTKKVKSLRSVQRHGVCLAWNAQGSKIAYATSESPELDDILICSRIYLVDVATDCSEDICEYPSAITDLCWYENTLIWSGEYSLGIRTTGRAVWALSLDKTRDGFSAIAHGEADCVETVKHCHDKIVAQVAHGLTDLLEVLDGKELYSKKQLLSSWDAHIGPCLTSLVFAQGRVGVPVEVFSMVDGNLVQLSSHGKEIADKNIGTAHLCEYTHDDGTPIDGFYAVPTKLESALAEKKAQPTIVYVRGGPYGRITNCFDYAWHLTTFFMSLGYLVLMPNYRGGSSHGHEYAHAVRGDSSQSYQDVIWLIKKGIEEGRIDPNLVSIVGWSQGGYLAYLSVTRDESFHFCAAIAGAGVSDWTTMGATSDLPHVEGELSGCHAWQMKDINDLQTRQCSPIFFTKNVTTPVLIVHGEADQRTPVEQAVGFYRALKAQNKDVKLVTYPREGHGSPMPWEKTHYIDMLERMEAFLKKHMERSLAFSGTSCG